MENGENKNLQGRREFFKEAAKKALPIIGAVALLGNPVIVKAVESEPGSCSKECYYGCYNGCKMGCSRGCNIQCTGNAKIAGCNGGCKTLCMGCTGTCWKDCKLSCYTFCDGSSK